MKLGILVILAALIMSPFYSFASDDDTETSGESDPKKTPQPPKKITTIKNARQLKVDDVVIRKNLKNSFDQLKTLNDHAIEAVVRNGEVTLRGSVGSIREKSLFDAVARTLPGVRKTQNHIIVRQDVRNPWPSHDSRRLPDVVEDELILKDVQKELRTKTPAKMSNLKLEVHLGVVIVTGQVENEEIRNKIREVALYTQKVRAVINNTWLEE
jgi:osmotically-inducible protein OsmY